MFGGITFHSDSGMFWSAKAVASLPGDQLTKANAPRPFPKLPDTLSHSAQRHTICLQTLGRGRLHRAGC